MAQTREHGGQPVGAGRKAGRKTAELLARITAQEAEIAALRDRCDAAEAASRTRADLIATISHEIREPMNGVLGMARLLRDTPLDEEQRSYIDAVLESAEALLTLINDVLDLSRVDAGRLELVPVDIELAAFLDRLAAQIAPRARQRGIGFACTSLPGTPAIVRADPARLRQVLLNLLGNALKFTEQGHIRLTVGPAAAAPGRLGLLIEVADTGIGIPGTALPGLFKAFTQAGSDTPRLFGGSGLGLVIAERLTRAMGGALGVQSRIGEGATFRLELALEPPQRSVGARQVEASLAGATLLVIDPQARTRELMAEMARRWGLLVHTARTGSQALARLHEAADRAAPVDIVVTDGGLRHPDPTQFARQVRAEPRLAHARLVLMVSSGMRGDAAAARAAGYAAYLPKPVTAETLLDCLRALRAPSHDPAAGLITVHSIVEQRPPRLRLLLADDNPLNCRLTGILLERVGHAVDSVHDGMAAVQAVAAGDYDLVLMDVHMPGVDGLEAASRIRALPDARRAAIPIVAITANAMRGDDRRCFAAGMNGYVTKPISAASLLEAIARHAPGSDGAAP